MNELDAGQIYHFDGGFFQAHYNEETDRITLHTYAGYAGHVVGRTGLDVDAGGHLYHRVFDFETREPLRIPTANHTVADLVPVDASEFDA